MLRIFNNIKIFPMIGLILISVGMIGLPGCSKKKANKTAKLAYVNWAEGVAMTNLAKAVLQDKMGYKVTTTMADVAPVYTSIANGDYDAFLDAWLPVLHKHYMDTYKNKLVDLGPDYVGTRNGLVVPSYVDATKISDLNKIKKSLDGKIIGIDSGAGIMTATAKAIDEYKLKLKLVPSSEGAMLASLKNAIDHHRPIVVTGWRPHWMFSRYDLKFLEDPKDVFGTQGHIDCIVRKNLHKDDPVLTQFLKNFKLDNAQLSDLMNKIQASDQNNQEPIVAATQWMKDHEALIDSWIPKTQQ